MALALFRTMVRLRLRLPLAENDLACPLCDGVTDKFGDHARVCPWGGNRVKRHNELRKLLGAQARAAGLQPELEKASVLPQELHGLAEDNFDAQSTFRYHFGIFTGGRPSISL